MFSKISVSNSIYRAVSKIDYKNILSITKSESLFNSFLLRNSKFINIIDKNNQPFDFLFHDDPLAVSENIISLYQTYNTPLLVFFHKKPRHDLKKEDKYLLAKKLEHAYKIFFSEDIKQSWSQSDNLSFLLQYGCPVTDIDNINKRKNIIILNLNQNPAINSIYEYIANYFTDCDILSSPTDDPINTISQYKIAISIDDIYDTLFCASCGCSVLTTCAYNNSLSSIYTIDNYNNIINQINNIMSNEIINITNIKNTQNFIKLNYSIDTFYKILDDNILNNLKYKIPNL